MFEIKRNIFFEFLKMLFSIFRQKNGELYVEFLKINSADPILIIQYFAELNNVCYNL